MEKDLQKLQVSSSKIEEQIKELQEKILEVGGVKLRSQKAVVDGIQEQISLLNERISKLKVERSTRQKSVTKAQKSIDVKEKELAELERELVDLKDQISSQAQAAEDVRARVKEAKLLLSQKEIEMEEMKIKLDKNAEVVNEIRRNQVKYCSKNKYAHLKWTSYIG